MTTSTRRAHAPAWVLAFLAAVLAVVLGAFTAAPASALTASTAQNAVGASTPTATASVGPSANITAGQRLGNDPPRAEFVVATGVAAETGGSVLNFGSRAAAREGLPGDLAGAGNRFFHGATSKSQDFQAVELPGGGYRMQFTSPANNPGYSKVYVQEIDRAGQVLREYKNTMGPDGLIETKWVHGGP